MDSDCPPWCAARHPDEDEAGQPRRHRGDAIAVPGVFEGDEGAEAAELVVERFRDGEDGPDWIYIGDGWRELVVTVETATRIAAALQAAAR